MTTYTKKLVYGSVIVLIISFLSNIFSYLLRILLARNLSQSEYGLIYAVFALFGLLSVFQHMGLQEALVKLIAEYRTKNEMEKVKTAIFTTFIIQISTALFLALIGVIFSGALAKYYFQIPIAKQIIILYAISIFLSPLELVFMCIFQGYQKMKLYSLITFFKALSLFLITAFFIHFEYGMYSILYAYILVYFFPFALYLPITLKKIIPDLFSVSKFFTIEMSNELFYYGIPVILSSVAGIVLTYTDTAMITYFKGVEQTALYNAAVPTSRLLWMLPQAFVVVLFPIATELWIKNKHFLKQGIGVLYKYTLITMFPLASMLFIYPELILRILFGNIYEPAATSLRILCIGGILFSISSVNGVLLTSIGKPKVNSKASWIAAIFNFFANLIVIPLYGIAGAAFSTLLAFVLIMIVTSIHVKKEIDIVLPWKEIIKTIFASIIFIVVLSALKKHLVLSIWLEIFTSISASFIIYVALIFILRIITISEIKDLVKKVKD